MSGIPLKEPRLGVWTEARTQQLRDLWAMGLPCKAIAARLGLTKNAVLGRAHRIGLPPHNFAVQKLNLQRGVVSRPPKPRPVPASRAPSVKRTPPNPLGGKIGKMTRARLALAGNGATLVEKPEGHEAKLPPIPAKAWHPLPGTQPVTLLNLSRLSCKWPVDVDGQMMFCGCMAISGRYCIPHATLGRAAPKPAPSAAEPFAKRRRAA